MIAGMSYYAICWDFLIYSFLGWCLEVVYQGVEKGLVVNRGFLNGPLCPIYGFGVLAILAIGNTMNSDGAENVAPWLLFLGGVVLSTAIELIGGILLDRIFHERWWDYSKKPWNFHGYICLEFSLIWGIAVVLVIRVLHPLVDQISTGQIIPAKYGWILLGCLYAGFLADFILSCMVAGGLNKELAELDELRGKMRSFSDGFSDVLGSTAIETAQELQMQRVQMNLAKAEAKETFETRKTEEEESAAARQERTRRALEEHRAKLAKKAAAHPVFGVGRMLRAFPDLTQHEHPGELTELRARMKRELGQIVKLPSEETDREETDQEEKAG